MRRAAGSHKKSGGIAPLYFAKETRVFRIMGVRAGIWPNPRVRRLPGIVVLLGVAACAQTAPGSRPVLTCPDADAYSATGNASWYGRLHHGRRTASGEAFDMHALTAAHRQLPFGTKIRVTNRRSGKSVVLKVNDRGPFVAGRFLDVSRRAARELGFIKAGIAPVRVETVASC